MIPSAIVRLKQGFGRLIRSKNDRGLDRLARRPRDISMRYGADRRLASAGEAGRDARRTACILRYVTLDEGSQGLPACEAAGKRATYKRTAMFFSKKFSSKRCLLRCRVAIIAEICSAESLLNWPSP
jgi:hypothetical protein